MDLHISTEEQIAIQSGWNGDAHSDITARIGDNWAVNAFFYSRNRRHRDRPYDLIHYAAAGVVANLIDFNGNVLATANLATELVPAVTAPVVTRVVPGTATVGEYDRITLPSPPGSGSLSVAMRGGTASLRGGTS